MALLFGLGLAGGTWWRLAHRPRLTILHVNDTHSHLEPVRTGEFSGMGGVLERIAYVDSVRKADGPQNVLLLHAGDFSQGTTYYTEFGAPMMVDIINATGYDAITLGNHEFDRGVQALASALSRCQVPVVVCNYDFSGCELGQYIRPYVIVEKAGRRIGIVGVLCSLGSMVKGEISDALVELDMVQSVQACVDQIRPQCDLVIALTHIGYEEHSPGDITDPLLCAATHGIDLFVGGHSHSLLTSPALVRNARFRRIPIVQVGWTGSYMGEMHL